MDSKAPSEWHPGIDAGDPDQLEGVDCVSPTLHAWSVAWQDVPPPEVYREIIELLRELGVE
jgi:hypothetical protein